MDKDTRLAPAAYSIDEFCFAHGKICRASYYNAKKAGKGPREMRVGARVLISEEAAAEWRRAREAEAAQAAAGFPRRAAPPDHRPPVAKSAPQCLPSGRNDGSIGIRGGAAPCVVMSESPPDAVPAVLWRTYR
jgi:hypothetical protein